MTNRRIRQVPDGTERPDPQVTLQWISPAIAADWLKRNTHNRPKRPYLVRKYAEDMRTGNWKVNGGTIVMGWDGSILDGQHRLEAVVDSGMSVQMLVCSGVDPDAFETIDSGRSRTPSDVLGIMGFPNRIQMAALGNMYLTWMRYGTTREIAGTEAPATTQQIVKICLENAEDFQEAIRVTARTRMLFGGGTVFAFYYLELAKIDRSDRDFFFERLLDGAGMEAGDPIGAARDAYTRAKGRNRVTSRNWMGAILVKAWNRYRNHEKAQLIAWSAQEDYPEAV